MSDMQRASSTSTTTVTDGSQSPKTTYGGLAMQYMYNAKAAVAGVFRKELKAIVDSTSPINCLGASGKGEDWLAVCCRNIQYFSYRNRLPQIIGNNLDHDAGWGCMVRTGQMMLCGALQRTVRKISAQQKGESSFYPSSSSPSSTGGAGSNLSTAAFHEGSNPREGGGGGGGATISIYSNATGAGGGALNLNAPGMKIPGSDLPSQMAHVIAMFRDVPQAEFSLYSIVNAGARFHIAPGEWFTATSLGLCLQHLVASKQDSVPIVAVHGKESTVELAEVEAGIATGKPVLVMVSVMLGMGNIDSGYFKAVHEVLGFPASVGIVGGKPKKSMFFFASQKETLFMLDPHYVQPAFVSPQTLGNPSGAMDYVAMAEADSSMLLAFLIEPSTAALDEWVNWAESKLPTLSEYPIFAICRRRSSKLKKAAGGGVVAGSASAASGPPSKATASASSSNTNNNNNNNSGGVAGNNKNNNTQASDGGFDCLSDDDDDFLAAELPDNNASAQARFRASFSEGSAASTRRSNNYNVDQFARTGTPDLIADLGVDLGVTLNAAAVRTDQKQNNHHHHNNNNNNNNGGNDIDLDDAFPVDMTRNVAGGAAAAHNGGGGPTLSDEYDDLLGVGPGIHIVEHQPEQQHHQQPAAPSGKDDEHIAFDDL